MDPLARLRAFPLAPPPNNRPESIKGNLSLKDKQLNANILAYHVAHYPGSKVFGHDATKGLQLVEINVTERAPGSGGTRSWLAETVCEIDVEDGMLNVHGTLSGGCAAHVLDTCTFSALFALGTVIGKDASALTMEGRISASRSEVYDKLSGRLLVSAVQTVAALKGQLNMNTGIPEAKL